MITALTHRDSTLCQATGSKLSVGSSGVTPVLLQGQSSRAGSGGDRKLQMGAHAGFGRIYGIWPWTEYYLYTKVRPRVDLAINNGEFGLTRGATTYLESATIEVATATDLDPCT